MPCKPEADTPDKSLQETCSYLLRCSANFAIETLYWFCLGLCQHGYPLGQYILIIYLRTVWNEEMVFWIRVTVGGLSSHSWTKSLSSGTGESRRNLRPPAPCGGETPFPSSRDVQPWCGGTAPCGFHPGFWAFTPSFGRETWHLCSQFDLMCKKIPSKQREL